MTPIPWQSLSSSYLPYFCFNFWLFWESKKYYSKYRFTLRVSPDFFTGLGFLLHWSLSLRSLPEFAKIVNTGYPLFTWVKMKRKLRIFTTNADYEMSKSTSRIHVNSSNTNHIVNKPIRLIPHLFINDTFSLSIV